MTDLRQRGMLSGIFVAIGAVWGLLKGIFDNDYGVFEGVVTGALAGALLFVLFMGVGYLITRLSSRH